MHVLTDHLTAILVASGVLLLLMASQFRTAESGTDASSYSLARRQAQALAQQLEGDLANVGYGVPHDESALTSWTDSTLVFRRKLELDTTAAVLVSTVTYRRRRTGWLTPATGSRTPLYTVERLVNGAAAGGMVAPASAFQIALVNASGTALTAPSTTGAAGIRVTYAAAFAARARDVEHNLARWSRTYYPARLN